MLSPVYFTDKITCQGVAIDDAYRKRNFDLCRAVNLTSLGVVLDEMVEKGMPKVQAELFMASAEALLQLMRTENNRIWANVSTKI